MFPTHGVVGSNPTKPKNSFSTHSENLISFFLRERIRKIITAFLDKNGNKLTLFVSSYYKRFGDSVFIFIVFCYEKKLWCLYKK